MLARRLIEYANRTDVIVLALPRGGVPIAYEVVKQLQIPLDIFLVRKLGVPWQEELAMGAIASGGVRILNEDLFRVLQLPASVIEEVTMKERQELARRERLYRGDKPFPNLKGRAVIVIDDGIATGSSMRAAVVALRQHQPERIIVATPVGAISTCNNLGKIANEVICLLTPEPLNSIGEWYEDFEQVTDNEVRDLLEQAAFSYREYLSRQGYTKAS
jgi:putative phosphoribosyl transferase